MAPHLPPDYDPDEVIAPLLVGRGEASFMPIPAEGGAVILSVPGRVAGALALRWDVAAVYGAQLLGAAVYARDNAGGAEPFDHEHGMTAIDLLASRALSALGVESNTADCAVCGEPLSYAEPSAEVGGHTVHARCTSESRNGDPKR